MVVSSTLGAGSVGSSACCTRTDMLSDRLRRAKERLRGSSFNFPPKVDAHVIHVWFDGVRFQAQNESIDQNLVFPTGWGTGQSRSLPAFLLFLADQLDGTLVDVWPSDLQVGAIAGLVLVPNV